MRLRIGVVALALVVAAAGCTSGNSEPAPGSPTATPSAAAAMYVASIPATIDTSRSGCNERVNGQGDCWLPLYPKPGLQGEPFNLGGTCTRTSQATCWPQPGDSVEVTCQVTLDGITYYGVTVPASRNMSHPAEDTRGFAEARFIRLKGQAYNLGPCTLGG